MIESFNVVVQIAVSFLKERIFPHVIRQLNIAERFLQTGTLIHLPGKLIYELFRFVIEGSIYCFLSKMLFKKNVFVMTLSIVMECFSPEDIVFSGYNQVPPVFSFLLVIVETVSLSECILLHEKPN